MKKFIMLCVMTLRDNKVLSFEAQNMQEVACECTKLGIEYAEDVRSITFEKIRIQDYEDSLFESVMSVKCILSELTKTSDRAIDLAENFDDVITYIGYDISKIYS